MTNPRTQINTKKEPSLIIGYSIGYFAVHKSWLENELNDEYEEALAAKPFQVKQLVENKRFRETSEDCIKRSAISMMDKNKL